MGKLKSNSFHVEVGREWEALVMYAYIMNKSPAFKYDEHALHNGRLAKIMNWKEDDDFHEYEPDEYHERRG